MALWRAYGDDCRGCSIEIEFPPHQLSNVLYGEREAAKTVPTMVSILEEGLPIIRDTISPLMKVGDEPNIQKTKERIARIIWGEIETVCYLYKSEAYDHEQECRFVMTEGKIQNETNSEIKFEYNSEVKGREVARHYYEHEALSTRNILTTCTKITLAPAAGDPYSLKLYLEDLLKKANLLGPTVKTLENPVPGKVTRRPITSVDALAPFSVPSSVASFAGQDHIPQNSHFSWIRIWGADQGDVGQVPTGQPWHPGLLFPCHHAPVMPYSAHG